MKKEEFTVLGISEELAAKAEKASLKELERYVSKEQFDTLNTENKNLKQSVSDRDKQLDQSLINIYEKKILLSSE